MTEARSLVERLRFEVNGMLASAACARKLHPDYRLTSPDQDESIAHLLREAADQIVADAEQCICAAIRLPNGEVWRGHRHDDAIQVAGKASVSREDIFAAEQGFITSRNRFVSREEGARIQRAAGIVSAQTLQPVNDMLFSEDLYLRDWRESRHGAE